MPLTPRLDQLRDRAEAWLADDPDPRTRAELASVLEAAVGGDESAAADLSDRFSGFLEFGTAGLRGALGAGPHRMNRAVVIRAAAGLTAYLRDEGGRREPMVVIGYDARHDSDVFARDSAAVVVGAGGRASILPRPLPTPVLAFAIRHLGADAGVMVTASHNPPQDNGYKVYLGDGSQIVPPNDAEIAAHIAEVGLVADVRLADDGWETLGDEVVDDYLEAVCRVVAAGSPRDLTVVHTSLHGVGHDIVLSAFERAGFPVPQAVPSQAQPDPDFPTVPFPNPEEAGAIDTALALAREVLPDLVLANDPDADRCAAAIFDPALEPGRGAPLSDNGADPEPAAGRPPVADLRTAPVAAARGEWRMLRGDEVGALLGWRALARTPGHEAVMASSIVSSRLLAAMAAAAGVTHVETLTGFKWIARVPDLTYGYEEALGYCVAPDIVRDKDGVSAALALAELAAGLKTKGRTLLDLLDDLAVAHGVHATDAFSVRVTDLGQIASVMARLHDAPPTCVADIDVVRLDDLARGDGGLPPTDGLRFLLADDSRVIVRPSGTEPKIKVYLEVIEPVVSSADGAGDGAGAGDRDGEGERATHANGETGGRAAALATARHTAGQRLAALRAEFEALTAL